jgi:biotin synthase-like enzyme
VVLGLYAKEILGIDAEPAGRFYIYKTKSWQEILRLVNKARELGLDVRS